MTFTDDDIRIEPGHFQRTWQSCDYYVGRTELFHERTYMRSPPPMRAGVGVRSLTPAQSLWLAGGPDPGDNTEQWLPGGGTKAEIEALAIKHGGFAHEEHYPEDEANPGYFLAFNDTEKALAFCRTPDFDALCATMEKLPA